MAVHLSKEPSVLDSQLRKDYQSVKKEIERTKEALKTTQSDGILVTNLLQKIRRRETLLPHEKEVLVSKLKLSQFDDEKKASLIVYRLKGVMEETRNRQVSLENSLHQLEKILSDLSICSDCNGTGFLIKQRHYERTEITIMPTEEQERCARCDGTGRVTQAL